MVKYVSALGCLGLCVLLAACGGAEYSGDKRFPLSGKATFDGQPIDLGSISFVPAGTTDAGGAPAPGTGGRSSGGVITDGQYAVPEEKGAPAGKYRVEISWLKRTGKQLRDAETGEMYDQRIEALPEKYHKKSQLTVDVPSDTGTYDFELQSN
jgi:hypothetical protein